MFKMASATLLFCSLSRIGLAGSAPQYSYFIIPNAPSGFQVASMNSSGQVLAFIGASGGFANGYTSFLRSRDGNLLTISFPGASLTTAQHINDLGRIVGKYFDAGKSQHSFIREPDGTYKQFPPALGLNASNNVGQLLGFTGDQNDYIWNPDGTTVTVRYPGSTYTYSTGLNDSGVVVGVACMDSSCKSTLRFLRTAAGQYQTILSTVPVPNDTNSYKTSINNIGQICGTSDKFRAFLLDADGSLRWLRDLGQLGGGVTITNRSEVLGFDAIGAWVADVGSPFQ